MLERLLATVRDGNDTTIEGVLVKFELKHKGTTTGYLRTGTTGTQVDSKNSSTGGMATRYCSNIICANR